MVKKIFRKIITLIMIQRGYSPHFAYIAFKERWDDLINNKMTWREKVWAQKRGFLSDKIKNYKLNENNYKNYLSDFDYMKMHPINKSYSKWIDDKLSTKLILCPFSENLPKYYFHILDGKLLCLDGLPKHYKNNLLDVINFLKEVEFLAMKKSSGTLAEGFFKLEYSSDNYFINGKKFNESEFKGFLEDKIISGYNFLITEFVHQHNDLNNIWSASPSVLRIMVLHELNKDPEIVRAYWRFGSQDINIVENPAAGGVICDIDVETGIFSQGARYEGNFLVNCEKHPDTEVLLEGITPHWEKIQQKIKIICRFVPELIYLGFDIIITDIGFKIIEINSHQGIKYLQYFRPLLIDEEINNFFKNKIR